MLIINGVSSTLTYDSRSRITNITTAAGGQTRSSAFSYDKNGLLKTTTSPDDITLTYTYNDA